MPPVDAAIQLGPLRPDGVRDAVALAGLTGVATGEPDEWREQLSDPRRVHVAAHREGVLVGVATALVVADVADLLVVAVEPASRRAGTGRAMVAAVVQECRQRGAARVLLEVRTDNEPALGLYASMGFARIATRPAYYRDGCDAAVLELRPAADAP